MEEETIKKELQIICEQLKQLENGILMLCKFIAGKPIDNEESDRLGLNIKKEMLHRNKFRGYLG